MENIKLKQCSKCKKELPATKEYFQKDKTRPDGFSYVCKNCRSKKKQKERFVEQGLKQCECCKEVLPLTEEYFRIHKKSSDGFYNKCIECLLKEKKNESLRGFKTCNTCNQTFPLHKDYFLEDKLYLDGHKNKCKQCMGKPFGTRERIIWTKKEDEILIKYYPYMPTKEIQEKYFPYRDEYSLRHRARKYLKLKKDEDYIKHKYWSKEQLDILINQYESTDNKTLAELIGKEPASVTAKAIELGLTKDYFWTEEEVNILIEKYPYMKTIAIQAKYFPNRNLNSINMKAQKLGLIKDGEYLKEVKIKTGKKNIKKIKVLKGKDNPKWVDKIKVNCAECNKELELLPSKIKNQENVFCSRKCQGTWRSKNYTGENNPLYGIAHTFWTEENRRRQAVNVIKRLKEMDKNKKKTKPQQIINNLLDEIGIKYINEYDCKYYLVDNYLTDYNLMIEVQGNFFHCNPVMNLENSRKDKIIGKDKSKHTYIKRYKGIEILYLWEKDINENLELCKRLILKYIENKGVLDNYHSFNYILNENGKLKLIDNLYTIGY